MTILDSIEAILRRTGCSPDLAFTPYRTGFKFELTRGVVITAAELQTLKDRLAARPPVDLVAADSEAERRNRNRAHRRASESDHA